MTRLAQATVAGIMLAALASATVFIVRGAPNGRVVDVALEHELRGDLAAIQGRAATVAARFTDPVKRDQALAIGRRAALATARLDSATVVTQPPTTSTPPPPPPPPETTADRVVTPDGNDGASGAPGVPWRTVTHAVSTATPGAVIEVREGTYPGELQVTRSGSAADPITLRASGRVVIHPAAGAGDRSAVRLSGGAAHWRFEGLTFRGATGPSTANIYGYGGSHDIVFSGGEITGSARQGVFLDRTTARYRFDGVNVHDNGGSGPAIQDHGLYLEGTGHVVQDTMVTDHPNGFGIQIYPRATNVTVRGGVVTRASKSGVVIGGQTSGTLIEGVRFVGPFGDGLAVDTYQLNGTGNTVRSSTADFLGAFRPRPGLTYTGNTEG